MDIFTAVLSGWVRTALIKVGLGPKWEVAVYEMNGNVPQLPAKISRFWNLSMAVQFMDEVLSFPQQLGMLGYISGYAGIDGYVYTRVTVVGTTLSGPRAGVVWGSQYPAGFKVRRSEALAS